MISFILWLWAFFQDTLGAYLLHFGITIFGSIGLAGIIGGLPGVLLGDVASSITVISIWKPYFLYRDGFKMNVSVYLEEYLVVFMSVCFVLAISGCHSFIITFIRTYGRLLWNGFSML